jgi:hypothetical protein
MPDFRVTYWQIGVRSPIATLSLIYFLSQRVRSELVRLFEYWGSYKVDRKDQIIPA